MLSDEERGLWATIRQHPEDDRPRLVYADWLEEAGRAERAEFIRVQCELAKLGPDRRKGRKQRVHLEPREKTLLGSHGPSWLAPFRAALAGSDPWHPTDDWLDRLTFRRGFVNGSFFGLETARRVAAADDKLEPMDHVWVTECGARYRHESVVEITSWSGVGCVLGLSVAWGGDRDIQAVTRSEFVRNLRHLGVWHGTLTDSGIAELASWPFAKSIQSLDFKDNAITDAGAVALADSAHIGQLRRLQLSGTRIGSAGAKRLRDRFGDAVQLP